MKSVRRAPPSRSASGLPAALPAMSHNAMSSPEIAYMTGPVRPSRCSLRCRSESSAGMSRSSRPVASGAIRFSSAACVAGHTANPNASPHPTMPASVSTCTSRISILRGLPAKSGLGPPISNGRFSAIGVTDLMVTPLNSFGPGAGILDDLRPLHDFFAYPCRELLRRAARGLETKIDEFRLHLGPFQRAVDDRIDALHVIP